MHHTSNYKKELKEALDIALFKKPAMHAVAAEKGKTTFGYYIIIAGALLGVIGQQIFPAFFKPGLIFSLVMGIMQVIMAVVGIYVLSYIAKKLFKGHAQHDQFFRVTAYGMIIMWLGLIPQLSIISGIWGLLLVFVILKTVHKLTTGGAVGSILVAIIALWIISYILSPVYGKFGMGSMMNFSGYGNSVRYDGSKVNVNGEGEVTFGKDTMKYTNEKGETVEWKIPKVND